MKTDRNKSWVCLTFLMHGYGAFRAYFLHRQRHFERRHLFTLLYALYAAAILGLIINALGFSIEPNAGLYALAATWMLVNAIMTFNQALQRFLEPAEKIIAEESVSLTVIKERLHKIR